MNGATQQQAVSRPSADGKGSLEIVDDRLSKWYEEKSAEDIKKLGPTSSAQPNAYWLGQLDSTGSGCKWQNYRKLSWGQTNLKRDWSSRKRLYIGWVPCSHERSRESASEEKRQPDSWHGPSEHREFSGTGSHFQACCWHGCWGCSVRSWQLGLGPLLYCDYSKECHVVKLKLWLSCYALI